MAKCLPTVSVMLESFTNISQCFLEETKTGFQVGVSLYTVYTTEWSALRLFPADDTPRLRPFYIFRRTNTCKGKTILLHRHCVQLCFGFENCGSARFVQALTSGYTILVPSATRLKMSLTSSSGRTKKFEFFHWLTKNECAAEMKITELYVFHFTSGPVDSSLARFTKNAKQINVPDRSEGIVEVST